MSSSSTPSVEWITSERVAQVEESWWGQERPRCQATLPPKLRAATNLSSVPARMHRAWLLLVRAMCIRPPGADIQDLFRMLSQSSAPQAIWLGRRYACSQTVGSPGNELSNAKCRYYASSALSDRPILRFSACTASVCYRRTLTSSATHVPRWTKKPSTERFLSTSRMWTLMRARS